MLHTEQGPLARLVVTDITALKAAQHSTLQHAARARQLHEELQTFLRSMTHELSTPQRQVEGFAALLERHLQPAGTTPARLLANLLQAARNLGVRWTSTVWSRWSSVNWRRCGRGAKCS
jgi:signal transduction histidine kinase